MGAIIEMQSMAGSSRSISVTVENGVKKINARDDEVKAYIEEQPDGFITIKVTRQYTRADLDTLMEEMPELYMHLKSIPDEADGAEVEVQVGVTRSYEAASADELEKNHPEAFEVYTRFTSGSTDDMRRLRDLRLEIPGLDFPEFRRAPRETPLDINPDDIRIHPDDDDEKKDPSESKDDQDGS